MLNASLKPMPNSRSVTTFCSQMTGVGRPSNIFISASISSVTMPSMSLPTSAEVPRIAASTTPSLGVNRRNAPIMPSVVIALAYLCAYGIPGKKVKSGYCSRFARKYWATSPIRSWVVHMKVVTPSS